ncbi:PTS sugar transporter subunit IIA [Aliivibrio fischeri]|uniref:PTS sugar transporter subunit IIA n=1 Tax=Aliivibrio fischeri TaxID=668 RepID=UPI00084BF24E|nr:PTS sugar transporter subunit IIA [Aliivibrio fischeri]OED53043.1 hypothetical protein BEI47_18340 [Aliivibrio fischeri]
MTIGIIVTGHINFATGTKSAVEAITGNQQAIKYVDFTEGTTRTELESLLIDACEIVDEGAGVLFCTDVPSGTPFQVSAQICTGKTNVSVLTGSNINMITEAVMERESFANVSDLADHIVDVGKLAIQSISF